MKKLSLLAALCVLAMSIKAQNSYGSIQYNHLPSNDCTSGFLTSVNGPGFLMGSINSYYNYGQPNFFVDRTNTNGQFSVPATFFRRAYTLMGGSPGNPCIAPPLTQINTCSNVQVIEAASGNYALVGTTDMGIFYAELGVNGGVLNQKFYPFPSGTITWSKALITESFVFPNEFFIVGSYNFKMYLMRVDNAGVIQAQYLNDQTGTGDNLQPWAIIESPYGSQNLVVVGSMFNYNGSQPQAFYYEIDNGLTTPAVNNYYSHTGSPYASFNSITISNSNSGGSPGFLVGGYSKLPSISGQSWVTRFDQTGNMVWSTLIDGSISLSRIVHGITERYSAANSTYENYNMAVSPAGIVVYKMDENGIPMSTYGLFDEFNYAISTSNPGLPVAITSNNLGATQDVGLHIYGTSGTYNYLAQSYFSGETGCSAITYINAYDQTMPNLTTWADITPAPAMNPCTNFQINSVIGGSSQVICPLNVSLPAPATNNKQMTSTSIAENSSDEITVFPNPVKDKLYIELKGKNSSSISLTLTDVLGRQIKLDEKTVVSGERIEVNLDKLNLPKGIYNLEIQENGTVTKQKIVYSAE